MTYDDDVDELDELDEELDEAPSTARPMSTATGLPAAVPGGRCAAAGAVSIEMDGAVPPQRSATSDDLD